MLVNRPSILVSHDREALGRWLYVRVADPAERKKLFDEIYVEPPYMRNIVKGTCTGIGYLNDCWRCGNMLGGTRV